MESNVPYSGSFPQAPYQPPQVNGYIQPRPRQVPVRPPEAPSSAPQNGMNNTGYVLGGYQPRPLTLPDPEALAARLDMDAYHVIRIEYFSLRFEPVMTVRDGNVTFNNCCIRSLNNAVWIHFLIGDDDDNTLIVRPRKEGTRGAVRWCIVKSDLRKSRTISCDRLTAKLYRRMNWKRIYHYKLVGTRVPYKNEEVYVFFLDSAIPVAPGSVAPDGRRIRQRIIEPEEWADSYGPTVKEIEASTQIDLDKGYTEELIQKRTKAGPGDGMPDAEQIQMEEVYGG